MKVLYYEFEEFQEFYQFKTPRRLVPFWGMIIPEYILIEILYETPIVAISKHKKIENLFISKDSR